MPRVFSSRHYRYAETPNPNFEVKYKKARTISTYRGKNELVGGLVDFPLFAA